mgnify:CR=1 FL=1
MKLYSKFYIKRSMLFQFFISYFCILAFTLFATSLINYQTTNILKQENNRANAAVLKQFSNALDDKFNNMLQLAVQAYNGTESELSLLNPYSKNDQDKLSPYARYRAHTFLHTLNTATKNMETVFIYYSSEDYIISLDSTIPSEEFYNCYYRSSHFTLEDWNDILKSHSVEGFTRFPSKHGDTSIAFVYSPFSPKRNIQDKVFVIFNLYALQQILADSKWESNGAFLVFNPNGSILASTNSHYDDIDLSPYFHMEGFFNMEHEGTEYVCKIIQSPSTKCYYASVTPKALAAEPVFYSQKMELIFSLVFIPIGLLACYVLSRRNYIPFKRLIQWIDEKSMYDPESFERGNEIDLLEKVLQLSFEEQEKLKTQIHNRKNELVLSSIRDLLYGLSSQGDSVQEVFDKNDIPLLSDHFAVILINIEKKYSTNKESSYSQDLLGFIITNVIEELAKEKHQGFVVPIDANRYACLVNFTSVDTLTMQQDLLSVAQNGKKFLEENFGIYFTVSLSAIHTDLDGIHQAFQEALYAMEYRLTIGSNKIIPYKQQQPTGSIYTFTFKTDHSINLFLKELKDSNQISSFVGELFDNRDIDSHTPPAIARDFIYDVAGSLSKAVNDMLPEDIQWKEDIYTRLINCDTLDLFRIQLINILEEYQEYLREKLSLNSISVQVRKYIEQYYHDPDLSVNVLADKFNLSPAYLSRIFKKENGISILDYISNCRINNAKELLRNTNKTIQQIAEETGFLSSSVFIRVFKKIEGITPGAYRKQSLTATAM